MADGVKIKAYLKDGELHIDGVEVSHPSKVNANYRVYPNARKKVKTFTIPYEKPVLAFHDTWKIIGYVNKSYYRPHSSIKSDVDAVVADLVITDEESIEKFKKKQFRTFSIGGAIEKQVCSICGKPIGECDHEIGEMYDGKLCYNKAFIDEYLEVSVVAVPADNMAFIPIDVLKEINTERSASLDSIDENRIFHDVLDGIDIEIDNIGGNLMEKIEELKNSILQKGMDKKFLNIFLSLFSSDEEEEQVKFLTYVDELLDNADDPDFFEKYAWDNDIDKDLWENGSLDDITENDAKVKYCGPNKTFPMHDCKHAAVALAMLRWPRVAAKYRGQIKKIRECIYRYGRAHKCPFATKGDESPENTQENTDTKDEVASTYQLMIEYGKALQAQIDLKDRVRELEDKKEELEQVIEDSKNLIVDLFKMIGIEDEEIGKIFKKSKPMDNIEELRDWVESGIMKKVIDTILSREITEDDTEADDTDDKDEDKDKDKDVNAKKISLDSESAREEIKNVLEGKK